MKKYVTLLAARIDSHDSKPLSIRTFNSYVTKGMIENLAVIPFVTGFNNMDDIVSYIKTTPQLYDFCKEEPPSVLFFEKESIAFLMPKNCCYERRAFNRLGWDLKQYNSIFRPDIETDKDLYLERCSRLNPNCDKIEVILDRCDSWLCVLGGNGINILKLGNDSWWAKNNEKIDSPTIESDVSAGWFSDWWKKHRKNILSIDGDFGKKIKEKKFPKLNGINYIQPGYLTKVPGTYKISRAINRLNEWATNELIDTFKSYRNTMDIGVLKRKLDLSVKCVGCELNKWDRTKRKSSCILLDNGASFVEEDTHSLQSICNITPFKCSDSSFRDYAIKLVSEQIIGSTTFDDSVYLFRFVFGKGIRREEKTYTIIGFEVNKENLIGYNFKTNERKLFTKDILYSDRDALVKTRVSNLDIGQLYKLVLLSAMVSPEVYDTIMKYCIQRGIAGFIPPEILKNAVHDIHNNTNKSDVDDLKLILVSTSKIMRIVSDYWDTVNPVQHIRSVTDEVNEALKIGDENSEDSSEIHVDSSVQ